MRARPPMTLVMGDCQEPHEGHSPEMMLVRSAAAGPSQDNRGRTESGSVEARQRGEQATAEVHPAAHSRAFRADRASRHPRGRTRRAKAAAGGDKAHAACPQGQATGCPGIGGQIARAACAVSSAPSPRDRRPGSRSRAAPGRGRREGQRLARRRKRHQRLCPGRAASPSRLSCGPCRVAASSGEPVRHEQQHNRPPAEARRLVAHRKPAF